MGESMIEGITIGAIIGLFYYGLLKRKRRYDAEQIAKRHGTLDAFNRLVHGGMAPAESWELCGGFDFGKYPGTIEKARQSLAPWDSI